MDQPFSKNELTAKVKKNPASPFFLVLTQLLIDENDLKNASKVCNSGLEHHPESIEGNFLLGKIQFREEHFSEAEKRLKFVINRHGAHINGYKLLGKIQRSLNRSPNTIKSTIDKILELNAEDSTALNWLQEIYQQEKPIKGNVLNSDPKEDKNNLTGMNQHRMELRNSESVMKNPSRSNWSHWHNTIHSSDVIEYEQIHDSLQHDDGFRLAVVLVRGNVCPVGMHDQHLMQGIFDFRMKTKPQTTPRSMFSFVTKICHFLLTQTHIRKAGIEHLGRFLCGHF